MHYISLVRISRYYIVHAPQAELPTQGRLVVRDRLILDCDEPAKTAGVVVGMPVSKARLLLPRAQVIPWQAEWYCQITKKWLDVCAKYSGVIEPVDQHEAYLDLSNHPNPAGIHSDLIRALKEVAGSPIRSGSGQFKWLADLSIHFGESALAVIAPDAFLAPLPIEQLSPIAVEHRERLLFLGYRTAGEVAQLPLEILQGQFGNLALTIQQVATGRFGDEVAALYPPHKLTDVMRWPGGISDLESYNASVREIATRLGSRLSVQEKQSTQLAITLEFEEQPSRRLSRISTKALQDPRTVMAALRLLLPESYEHAPTALRVELRNLKAANRVQTVLGGFNVQRERETVLSNTISQLATAYRPNVVIPAAQVILPRRRQVLRGWNSVMSDQKPR